MNAPLINTSPAVSDEVRKTTCYMCACRCGINVHMKSGKVSYAGDSPQPLAAAVETGRPARVGRV